MELSKDVCLVVAGSVDCGKCFAKGTKIMKYDCSIENVENLKPGDLLMGDDSTPREILGTNIGFSQLYKITPQKGQSYVTNGYHILCLKDDKNIVEISVNEFINLDHDRQNKLKWYHVGVDFKYQDTPIEPYLYGHYMANNYIKNSEIVSLYKYNSRQVRMELLAGIVDSIGHYNSNTNSYFLNDTHIARNDLVFLIRSLGFQIYDNEFYGPEQDFIPVRNEPNKAKTRNNCDYTILVEPVEIDQYYGFSLDGNKRFLLEDFSVSHNSTFIGVMTSGELDDGKGSARAKVAKHPHEVREGKTSDISTKNLTVDGKEIVLVDLCGHEKYLKTTLFGITGFFPDYGIIIVSANRGLLKMTREHMGILLYMKIPFIVLITRVDVTPKAIYDKTVDTLTLLLKKHKYEALMLNNIDDIGLENADMAKRESEFKPQLTEAAKSLKTNRFKVPVLSISCKSGYYVDSAKSLLSQLEPRKVWEDTNPVGSIFYIDSKFSPVGIGLVVSGLVKGKSINVGSELLIGPYNNEFKRVKAWSMHNNTKNVVQTLHDRQRGCLAIKPLDGKEDVTKLSIRKGMIIISKESENNICYEFMAKINILNHSTVISKKYTPVIHCGTVRQSARIVITENQELKAGDEAEVRFRFVQTPEYIEKDSIFFFREGTTRGVGIVTDILKIKDDPNPHPAEQKRQKTSRRKFYRNKNNKGRRDKQTNKIGVI